MNKKTWGKIIEVLQKAMNEDVKKGLNPMTIYLSDKDIAAIKSGEIKRCCGTENCSNTVYVVYVGKEQFF